MEPIKITDKLTLRQEALRMAIEASKSNATYDVVKSAKEYAYYIQGDSDLPERDNLMEKYLQEMQGMLTRQHNPWYPADGDIKPPHDTFILGHENGSTYKCQYTDDGEFIIADGEVFHPTHWMPMPLPPTLNPTA